MRISRLSRQGVQEQGEGLSTASMRVVRAGSTANSDRASCFRTRLATYRRSSLSGLQKCRLRAWQCLGRQRARSQRTTLPSSWVAASCRFSTRGGTRKKSEAHFVEGLALELDAREMLEEVEMLEDVDDEAEGGLGVDGVVIRVLGGVINGWGVIGICCSVVVMAETGLGMNVTVMLPSAAVAVLEGLTFGNDVESASLLDKDESMLRGPFSAHNGAFRLGRGSHSS